MARGGKRDGAGRKPSTIKGLVKKLGKFDAEALLAKINGGHKWVELATSGDLRIELEVMKYLTDRAYGKATQPLEHSGEINTNGLSDDERAAKIAAILNAAKSRKNGK